MAPKRSSGSASQPSNDQNRNDEQLTHEPDERTSLLREGYLDPDDPAVSPYNLWSVRVLRLFTVIFSCINFVWWTLLLVSIFISPPGLHTRGSGFFDFAFTTLTGGILLVSLLFFTNPSKAMRVTSGIVALFLFVDVIIIVSVERTRAEEGPVGISSAIWAFLMSIWVIGTDRVVAVAKREEEVRLTGREETRRTLAEWFAVLIATVILIVYVAIVVLMTSTLILRARDASLPMHGQRYFVDGDKYSIHVACVGNVTKTADGFKLPSILLEGGENPVENDFEPWAYELWNSGNTNISRYCYWDRPGYAWSENAPSPHSAGMSAAALSEALARAGEEGPWILTAHGYGALVARIFASMRAPGEVFGLLLIDPFHEDLLHRIGAPSRGFWLWIRGILSPLGLDRIPGAIFRGRTREDRIYGIAAYQGGKLVKARLQENLVADSLTKSEVSSAKIVQDKSTPLVVVSSGKECKKDSEWERVQEASSKITDNLLSWEIVDDAAHEVWRSASGRQALEKGLSHLIRVIIGKPLNHTSGTSGT